MFSILLRNPLWRQMIFRKIPLSVSSVGRALMLFPSPPTRILLFFGRLSNVKLYF